MRCNLCDNRTQNEQIFVPGNNFLNLQVITKSQVVVRGLHTYLKSLCSEYKHAFNPISSTMDTLNKESLWVFKLYLDLFFVFWDLVNLITF